MAKQLTKTQTIELAQNLGRKNEAVQNMTVAEWDAMEYSDRLKWAVQVTADVFAALPVETLATIKDEYIGAFKSAHSDQISGMCYSKSKALAKARHDFKRWASSKTVQQVTTELAELAKGSGVRGLSLRNFLTDVSIEVDRAGLEGSLYVRFDSNFDECIVNPDDANHRVISYALRLDISWSSSNRTPAQAAVAVKVYQDLVDLANEIEATYSRERIVTVHGGATEENQ
jgi:hypothetical protein